MCCGAVTEPTHIFFCYISQEAAQPKLINMPGYLVTDHSDVKQHKIIFILHVLALLFALETQNNE